MAVAILFLLACAVPASLTQKYICQINRPRADCGEPLCQSQLDYYAVYENLRRKYQLCKLHVSAQLTPSRLL